VYSSKDMYTLIKTNPQYVNELWYGNYKLKATKKKISQQGRQCMNSTT